MADDLDDVILGAGLGAGLLGLGYLAWKGFEKRKLFRDRLAEGLATYGITLVYPDLGFLPDGRHVWHLTIEGPVGAVTLQSPLLAGTDPYAVSTVDDLVRRVAVWLTHAA